MANLTAARNLNISVPGFKYELPAGEEAMLWMGAQLIIGDDGKVTRQAGAAGRAFAGFSEVDQRVKVDRAVRIHLPDRLSLPYAGAAVTDGGRAVYAHGDDQTVAFVATNGTLIGRALKAYPDTNHVMIDTRVQGSGGGGTIGLGPLPNVFGDDTTADRAAAEALRDAQAVAEPDWLVLYNGNLAFWIRLVWLDGVVEQRRNVAATAWEDVTNVVRGLRGPEGQPGAAADLADILAAIRQGTHIRIDRTPDHITINVDLGGGGGTPTTYTYYAGIAETDPPTAADFTVSGTSPALALPVSAIPAGERRYLIHAKPDAAGPYSHAYYYEPSSPNTTNVYRTSFVDGSGTIELGGEPYVWIRSRMPLPEPSGDRTLNAQ